MFHYGIVIVREPIVRICVWELKRLVAMKQSSRIDIWHVDGMDTTTAAEYAKTTNKKFHSHAS